MMTASDALVPRICSVASTSASDDAASPQQRRAVAGGRLPKKLTAQDKTHGSIFCARQPRQCSPVFAFIAGPNVAHRPVNHRASQAFWRV